MRAGRVKKKEDAPRILVLGAKGMLGHVVRRYLKQKFPRTVWGTDRFDKKLLYFDGLDPEKSYERVLRHIGKIDIMINCIALLRPSTKHSLSQEMMTTYQKVNTELPHILERVAERDGFHLIHISTDAVFSPVSGEVYEDSPVSPNGVYEETKYAGETKSDCALTIRTSIVGLDPHHHKGILEWVISQKEGNIQGYVNQMWSGCTTLQLAELCCRLCDPAVFSRLRNKTPVVHFAPLKPTKYDLVKTILAFTKSETRIVSGDGIFISRIIKSRYDNMKILQRFNANPTTAIAELFKYEKGQ